ncbi:MAG: SpoIIE family protein phosphatase [Gammaproteobacteria bacterium]|nr:SpoIIE family protein phosphatase [Gammaproteobacteria bacterium]MDX2458954.1 SpoIIE family protein phosphatase [Gammaproteobacteria bacterium]
MVATVSIYRRLLTRFLPVIVLLGAAIMLTTFVGARRTVQSLSADVIAQITNEVQARLEQFFEPAFSGLALARAWGEAGHLVIEEAERVNEILAPIMRQYPQITSVLVADERGREHMLLRIGDVWSNRRTRPDQWGTRSRWIEWKDGEQPSEEWRELDYDPRERPWYRGAMALEGVLHWTEPYEFFTTKEPGITASVTFERGDGILRVVAFDLLLKDLLRFTTGLSTERIGEVFVLTEDMRAIGRPASPRLSHARSREAVLPTSPAELGPTLIANAVTALGEDSIDAAPRRFESGGQAWWGAVRSFALGSWRGLRLVTAVPEAELLGRIVQIRWWIVGITLAAIGFAVWLATGLAREVSRPIQALARESDRIGRGDLVRGESIVTPLDEVQRLVSAQNQMRDALDTLMKLERDLQLARQIQLSTFPGRLPRLKALDLAAWSEPAEETGGDTYDLIGVRSAESGDLLLVEEDAERVVLLLADATGHGIGPALSATEVRAMLRMAVRTGASLEETVRHLNEQLCQDLTEGRFVTMWLAEFSSDSRTLRSFSAGQAPLLHYVAADRDVRVLDADTPPLGILEDIDTSAAAPIALGRGDLFAAISDGIFEAQDLDGQMFGVERVIAIIREHANSLPEVVLERLRAAVLEFARGTPAADDQTAILVKCK